MTDELTDAADRSVMVRADLDEPSTVWVLGRLEKALADRGLQMITSPTDREARGAAAVIIAELDVGLAEDLTGQGYVVDADGTAGSLRVRAPGRAGLMYGLLTIAETVTDGGLDALARLAGERKAPYLTHRGIKFNLPLDARTPSYNDDGDSAPPNIAVVWELAFWEQLLDHLAAERYNLVSLWNLHPFPSMVKTDDYPEVALDDVLAGTVLPGAHTTGVGMFNPRVAASMVVVKKMTIAEKIDFWRSVMQLAHDRCIEIVIFTWNVFTYGTEGNPYGIDDSLDSRVGKDYLRASVRSLFSTYPLLAGVGVTAGEHMDRHADGSVNQQWLRDTYGAAIEETRRAEPDRTVRLIHRTHWADMAEIERLFSDVDVPLEFSYKYSSAHLHALARPTYIDQDGFLDSLPDNARFWLTVRDDDHYLLRSGDPEFARAYLTQLPGRDRLNGFYLGPDGYTIGREFLTESEDGDPERQLVVDRQWYFFAVYGQLSYDPTLEPSYFEGRLTRRYPGVDAVRLRRVWQRASEIVPVVNQFHFGGNRFDLDWYPEACMSHLRQRRGFHTVHDFVRCSPMPTSAMMSIPDAHAGRTDARSPGSVADELDQTASAVLEDVDVLRHDSTDLLSGAEEELAGLLIDLTAFAALGRYYAAKIRGACAVHALTVDPPGGGRTRREAVDHLTSASERWREYAELVHSRYRPQRLSRLGAALIDLRVLQTEVDYDITLARSAGYDEYGPAPTTMHRAG